MIVWILHMPACNMILMQGTKPNFRIRHHSEKSGINDLISWHMITYSNVTSSNVVTNGNITYVWTPKGPLILDA